MNYVIRGRKVGLDEQGKPFMEVVLINHRRSILVELRPEDVFQFLGVAMRGDLDTLQGAVVDVEEPGDGVLITHPINPELSVTGRILDVQEKESA